jgi:hypothetical protein
LFGKNAQVTAFHDDLHAVPMAQTGADRESLMPLAKSAFTGRWR